MENLKLEQNLTKMINVAVPFVKWEKRNPLKKKAIFLYKETSLGYVYLVENDGEPFYGYYAKTEFKNILDKGITSLNIQKIKDVILKNIKYRQESLMKRFEQTSACALDIIDI